MTGHAPGPSRLDTDTQGLDRPVRAEMSAIDTRARILEHFVRSSTDDAGRHDAQRAFELYADDVLLEWPQGRERIRGRSGITAFRSASPNRLAFEVHRITGCHDLWVNEYTIRNDGRPVRAVGSMEFHDSEVVRERVHLGQHWEPPPWRSRWVERRYREGSLVSA